MSLNLKSLVKFDYELCLDHNIVVEFGNEQKHMEEFCRDEPHNCQFLGQMYNIKKPGHKLSLDISKRLVDGIREKENIKRYEKDYDKKLKQRKRDQDNYSRQIPLGDSIINLEVVKLDVV